jgi:hypothetical protein
MKPERIEELAETAFHLASPAHKWEFSHESWKDRYRDIARTLYAAAMRDAAGVADYGVQRAYRDFHDRKLAEGAQAMATEIFQAIRAMKGGET